MALPLMLAAAGAGLGLLKSEFVDKPNEEKDRILQSLTDRYSPWTGLRGKMVDHTNPLGEAAAMGSQGATQGSELAASSARDALNQAIAGKLGAKTKGGADQMADQAVATANGGAAPSGASSLGAPLAKDSSGLGDFDPKSADGALTLALLSNAMKNRSLSGLS
jgi:hypothetical protein